MEIFTLLETLEEALEKSRTIPFSDKCIVDKEEFFEIIKEIRIKLKRSARRSVGRAFLIAEYVNFCKLADKY